MLNAAELPSNQVYATGSAGNRRKRSSPINLRFVWLPLLALLLELLRSQNFARLHPLEIALGTIITALCFVPAFVWASQSEREPPAFQCFCAIHYPYYAYPLITANSTYLRSATESRLLACATVAVYLLTATIVYYANRPKDFCSRPTKLIQIREIPERTAKELAFALLLAWSAFSIALTFGYLSSLLTPSLRNTVYTTFTGAGTLGVWTLARQVGARRLNGAEHFLFLAIFISTLVVISSTILLSVTIVFSILALVAFSLGRNKVPWVTLLLVAVLFTFFNFGKGPARSKIWVGGSAPTTTLRSMWDTYSTWFSASFDTILKSDQRVYEERSIFNRANFMHVQARIVDTIPARKPFLYGETYEYIPLLLVPRAFWKEKPTVHVANNIISMYCGLSGLGNRATTTIGVGILGEAWANFGWFGIIGTAMLIGAVMRTMAGACAAAKPTMLHSLISVVWIAYSFQIEQASSAWLSSFIQAVTVLIVLMYPFSHPVRTSQTQEKKSTDSFAPGVS